MLEGGGATGLRNKGGGIRSNRLPGLVTKQQDVEFPQVLASRNTECCVTQCYSYMKENFTCCPAISNDPGRPENNSK